MDGNPPKDRWWPHAEKTVRTRVVCRVCRAKMTLADTGFTTCNACAWAARKAKRKEGTAQ